MGALVMGLPPEKRATVGRMLPFTMSYNLGRLASYAMAGGLLAYLGGGLFDVLDTDTGHSILRIIAGVLMFSIGLYLAGWFPAFMRIEKIGIPIWQKLQPIGARFMPVDSVAKAFAFGLIWGWLPCGLVYSVLFTAAAQGTATGGALYMLAFGLGTLPSVVVTGVLMGRAGHLHQQAWIKKIGGTIIMVLALITLIWPGIGAPASIEALCVVPH